MQSSYAKGPDAPPPCQSHFSANQNKTLDWRTQPFKFWLDAEFHFLTPAPLKARGSMQKQHQTASKCLLNICVLSTIADTPGTAGKHTPALKKLSWLFTWLKIDTFKYW